MDLYFMLQLIVNSELLREIDEIALINFYGIWYYENEESVENEIIIKNNLEKILNWDVKGHDGLGIYCGKFENIKRKDWDRLIEFIKDKKYDIQKVANTGQARKRRKSDRKIVLDTLELKEEYNKKRFSDPNYKVSGKGKKAIPCEYKGKHYQSRQQCKYAENLSDYELYQYLKKTGQHGAN